MTEGEWLTCSDPSRLLASLFARKKRDTYIASNDERFRRFAIACCRRVADVLEFGDTYALDCLEIYASSKLREAILKARRFHRPAGNKASRELSAVGGADGVIRLRAQARSLGSSAVWTCTKSKPSQAAMAYREAAAAVATVKTSGSPIPDSHHFNEWLPPDPDELAVQASLLRDIFGNPFRPVTLNPAVLAWNDATIVRIARGAYEERALPSGELDRTRLTILADALEEAGCGNADILNHFRGPGLHVRGCWAVDAILNKS